MFMIISFNLFSSWQLYRYFSSGPATIFPSGFTLNSVVSLIIAKLDSVVCEHYRWFDIHIPILGFFIFLTAMIIRDLFQAHLTGFNINLWYQ